MTDDRVSHWLTRTNRTNTPRRIVCVDTEAVIDRDGVTQTHTFRLGAGSFDILDKDRRPTNNTKRVDFSDGESLWKWVDGCTAKGSRTVVFAHNITYDLRLTDGLEVLPRIGWTLQGMALTSYSFWARFTRESRGLTLCDTQSWHPGTLEQAAADLNLAHRRLPPWNAGDERWRERCRSDVEVLRALAIAIVQWVHDDDLGDFRLTGAAQASAVFRRRFLKPSKLLVHDDDEALAAERRASWTGRCELWRHGRIQSAVYEYDFDSAYARLARQLLIPGRLLGGAAPIPLARWTSTTRDLAVLSECVVTTETPTVPAALGDSIVWPVGTFTTTLWDVEVDLARSEGATVVTGWHWLYERSDALHEWAQWILDGLDGAPPGNEPFKRRVLKGWSRSLIGRFGLRYQDLDWLATATDSKVVMYPVRDEESGAALTWLQVGREVYERSGLVETADSLPQVTSYVMAAARARLWGAMRAFGLPNVLYVDTDGLLTTLPPAKARVALAGVQEALGLREKAWWPGATLRSPRNLDVGDERRIAGVPRRAQQTGPESFQYEAWETLPGALARSRSDRVIVTERRAHVTGNDPRRLHVDHGRTEPLRLAVVDGVNVAAA